EYYGSKAKRVRSGTSAGADSAEPSTSDSLSESTISPTRECCSSPSEQSTSTQLRKQTDRSTTSSLLNYFRLSSVLIQGEEATIKFLQEKGFIRQTKLCHKCPDKPALSLQFRKDGNPRWICRHQKSRR
ncbi:unnamed protein product, partial [Allacma fusca]